MKIHNTDKLATSELRKDALAIAEAGLIAIDTYTVIKDSVRLEEGRLCVNETICTLEGIKRIFVVGVGKCSLAAAQALEEVLGDTLEGGIVCDVRECDPGMLKKVTAYCGTHPFPSETNIEITEQMMELLSDVREDDLVLVVVSGGGSTLLCNPDEGMTCVNEQAILGALFENGATIQEINTIRKHISLARGGFVAQAAYPAQVIGLIFSDVPGNDMEMIASGPTVKDTTTVEDADAILAKYDILKTCSIDHCGLTETPKADKYFEKVQNVLLVTNERALDAMSETASELGYASQVKNTELTGEARERGEEIVNDLHEQSEKSAVFYGGETTVTVSGTGQGGRNQELALAALAGIRNGELLLTLASDGRDNSDHAGALVDSDVDSEHIQQYLDANNSEEFFKKSGTAIKTGYTGSNVADLIIALKGP